MTIISNRLPNIQLIGIHGHAGVGKDTIGDYLCTRYEKTYSEAFASPLKEACSEAFGMSLGNFNDPELKDTIDPYWKLTPRKILQFLGTEVFRSQISKFVEIPEGDFWLHRMHGRLIGELVRDHRDGIYEDEDTVIITDVRFQNEYEYITQNGGWIIHLLRPGHEGKVGIAGHTSESGVEITAPEVTYLIDNRGTLEELYEKVETFITNSELNLSIKPD